MRYATICKSTPSYWMKHVRWWIDSTDIRLPLTKQYKSHKGSYWLHKLEAPALRVVCSARTWRRGEAAPSDTTGAVVTCI